MANIIYTPASVSDPKNSPQRIYFSCHPQDFVLFDRIASDIRRSAPDAVIAHLDFSAEVTDLDHVRELDDFHLIVIPVTANWLNADDPTSTGEFLFITEHRKAVLPLLFDTSLEQQFNRKTENLQYLCVNDPDYIEKMQRSLSDILIDPKLAESIRKVFTHKMFASYCKEDVGMVQELIRLIHSHDEFRRIAIWYDKYLPTGRNFRDSIFQNLDDSHIFGLTVTPTLISRDNFVKDEEYPYAVANGKKMAIFEMSPTDHNTLNADFGGIDTYDWQQSVDKRNILEFFRRILNDTEGNTVNLPKDKTDYLLGLAYLNGTFVEIDSKYAIKKLDALSDKGDVNATLELIKIYRYGKGVTRNMDTVKHYCFKLLTYLEKQFFVHFNAMKKDRFMPIHYTTVQQRQTFAANVENARKYALQFMHRSIDFARLLRDEGYITDAEKCYRKALKIIEEADGFASEMELGKRFRTQIENELNLTLMAAQKPHDSMHFTWQRALEEYENEPQKYEVANNTVNCGRIYGFDLLKNGDLTKSREVLEKTLEIAEKWPNERTIYECKLCALRDLGRLCSQQNDPHGAIQWFARELDAFNKAPFSLDENSYLKFTPVWGLINIGHAYGQTGNHQEAVKDYRLGLLMASEFEKQFGEKAYTLDFPVTFLQIYATAYGYLANYEYEEPCPEFVNDIEGILGRFGKLKYNADHIKQAKEYLDKLRNSAEYFKKLN